NQLSSSARTHKSIGLLLIDLDDFKQVNDTYGHPTGDMLLKQVADRLQNSIRETDLVARLGGDEFGIALTMMSEGDDIEIVLKKVKAAFTRPFQLGDFTLFCSASIGAITQSLDNPFSFQEFFRRADISLYGAKFKGKNTTQLYHTSSAPPKPAKPKKLTSRVQIALENNEFQVFYQPKIDMSDQGICGAEALVRWFPENGPPITPSEFIPAAELSGDIIPIGEWVLNTVCAQMKEWREKMSISLPVAVNMSPIQIGREETVTLIQENLKKHQISPELLEIEITETTSLLNSNLFARHLQAIHDIGCPITVDDFGIGYSSFLRFLDLPVSSLKIDQSFIAEISQSQKANAICKSIMALAQTLNIPVTAEGIETPSQLIAIENLDCQYAQGFYIKEPVPADHFMTWYTEHHTTLQTHTSAYLN
ncbi:MAG: bifunctional diguanylate cyclase/phosphodiesterase, partial [Sneathiella sp.]